MFVEFFHNLNLLIDEIVDGGGISFGRYRTMGVASEFVFDWGCF